MLKSYLGTWVGYSLVDSPIGLVYVTRGWRRMRRISRHFPFNSKVVSVGDPLNPSPHIYKTSYVHRTVPTIRYTLKSLYNRAHFARTDSVGYWSGLASAG